MCILEILGLSLMFYITFRVMLALFYLILNIVSLFHNLCYRGTLVNGHRDTPPLDPFKPTERLDLKTMHSAVPVTILKLTSLLYDEKAKPG